jgi:PKD repeat protein
MKKLSQLLLLLGSLLFQQHLLAQCTITFVSDVSNPSGTGPTYSHTFRLKNSSATTCNAQNYYLVGYAGYKKVNGSWTACRLNSNITTNPFSISRNQTIDVPVTFTVAPDCGNGEYKIEYNIRDGNNNALPVLSGGRLYSLFTYTVGSCDVPSNPTSSPTENGATVSWDNTLYGTSYLIFYTRTATWDNSVTATSNQKVLSGLACNTTYYWTVRSTCSGLGTTSDWLPAQSFTTTACPAPQMEVQDANGTVISNNGSTNWPNDLTMNQGEWLRFRIYNRGNANLTINNTSVSNSNDFGVYQPPASTIGANSYADFKISCKALRPDNQCTDVLIGSNDGNNSSFRFNLCANVINPCVAPTITTQPASTIICSNNSVHLYVGATGAEAYQWQHDENGTWNNISNATSESYLFNAETTGDYRCVVSKLCGEKVVSDPATVTVDTKATGTIDASNLNPVVGEAVTFSLAGFEEATYKWTFPDGTPSSSTEGAPVVTFAQAGVKTVRFTATAQNGCGNSPEQTLTITVKEDCTPPEITVQPQATTTVCSGKSVTLSVTATNGHKYKWQQSGANDTWTDVPNATARTYTFTPQISGRYRCIVIRNCSEVSETESEIAEVTVNAKPTGTIVPDNLEPLVGEAFSFNLDGFDEVDYSWTFAGGTPATSTEPAPSVTFAQAGVKTIQFKATSKFGCGIFEKTLTITVKEACIAPEITTEPQAFEGCKGETVNLSITATNADKYQWQSLQNTIWTDIPNANQRIYIFNAQKDSTFRCVLTRNCGGDAVISNEAVITVDTLPNGIIKADLMNPIVGQEVLFELEGYDNATEYSWTFAGGTPATSTDVNQSVVFATTGAHLVKFKAKGKCGFSIERVLTIQVSASCGVELTNILVHHETCGKADGSLTVTATGTDLQYALDGTTYQVSNVFEHLTAGAYTITVKDASNCTVKSALQTIESIGNEPVANFTNVVTNLSVSFTNTSTNVVGATYLWNFGDNTTNTEANPTHVYTQAGTFAVALTVSTACGSSTMTRNVIVSQGCLQPVANFTNVATNFSVVFTNTSTNATGAAYSWNFGNGQTSTQANPTITYATAGSYNVTLTITTSCGTNTISQSITVTDCPSSLAEFDIYSGLNNGIAVSKEGYAYYNGTHYVVYSNGHYNGNAVYAAYDAKVKLATSTDGKTWKTEDILNTTIGSHTHVLTVDNNGKLHVAYIEGTGAGYYGLQSGTLVYANNVNGTWVKQNTDLGTGNGYIYNWTTPYQLLFGKDGKLRMYYTTTGWWAYGAPLYMRVLENGTWGNPITIANTNDGGADSQNNIWSFTKKANGETSVYLSSGWQCGYAGCTSTFYNNMKVFTEGNNYAYTQTTTIPNARWYHENTSGSKVSVGADGRTISVNDKVIATLPDGETVYNNVWLNEQGNQVIANTSTNSRIFDATTGQVIVNNTGKFIIPAKNFNLVVDYGANPRRLYAQLASNPVNVTVAFTANANQLTINFSNNSTNATTYKWDFGNGQTSTERNPSFTFAQAGTYNVCLTAFNDCNSAQTCQAITVNCVAPAVTISGNSTVCAGSSTTLSATGSGSYRWSNGSTTSAITVNQAGSYTVTVTNAQGCTSVSSPFVVQLLAQPVSDFAFAATNWSVAFTNTSTNVVGATYLWNFGDNTTNTEANPTHVYTQAGTFTVSLTATTCSANTMNHTITITAAPSDSTKVIYSNNPVIGISNAKFIGNDIQLAVATNPVPQPAGYPDAGTWAGTMQLLTQNGLAANGQVYVGAFSSGDVDIEKTPNDKLGIVYQYPTGNSYGFQPVYKVWNGQTIETDSRFGQEANWYYLPRLKYGSDNVPRISSFGHAGYILKYFTQNNGNWVTSNMTGYGTHYSPQAAAMDGNIHYVATRNNTTAPNPIVLFKNTNGTWTTDVVAASSSNICDLVVENGNLYVLFNQGADLKLASRSLSSNTWNTETIVNQDSIYHRASIHFNADHTPFVIFQKGHTSNTALKVLKKAGNLWNPVFTKSDFTFDANYWSWGRRPSLVSKSDGMYAVYSDNRKVYLTHLRTVNCVTVEIRRDTTICMGKSIQVGTHLYTQTGLYRDTLQMQNGGCDSIIITNLIVTPPQYVRIDTSICANKTLIINGRTYRQAGNYQDTLRAGDCINQVLSLTLRLNPLNTQTQNLTLCAGDSVKLGNRWRKTAGTYTDTLFAQREVCDTQRITNLQFVQPVTSTQLFELCEGDSLRLYNRRWIYTGGTFKDTLRNFQGCDSIVISIVNLKPASRNTLRYTICQGSTVTVGGQRFDQTGVHTVKIPNDVGCDSIITLYLQVNPTKRDTIRQSICQGSSYLFGNRLLTESGTYNLRLRTVLNCDSTVVLYLLVLPSFEQTHLVTICEGESVQVARHSYKVSGVFRDTFHTIDGCDSIIITKLTVNPLPRASFIARPNFNVVTFEPNSSNAQRYLWRFGDGETSDLAQPTHPYRVGTYQVTLLVYNNCGKDSSTVSLTIRIPTVYAAQNKELCFGKTLVLNNHVYKTAGSYTDTLRSIWGGDTIMTTHLTILPALEQTIQVNLCQGASYRLRDGRLVDTAGTFTSFISTAGICDSVITTIVTLQANSRVEVDTTLCQGSWLILPDNRSVNIAGVYESHLKTVAGCELLILTRLRLIQRATLPTAPISTGGIGSPDIRFTFDNLDPNFTYTLHFGDSSHQTIRLRDTVWHHYQHDGTFKVQLIMHAPCGTDTFRMNVPAVFPLRVTMVYPKTVCEGDSVPFRYTTQSGAVTSQIWQLPNASPGFSVLAQPSATYKVAGRYPVKLQVENALISLDLIDSITVKPRSKANFNTIVNGLSAEFSPIMLHGLTYRWDFGDNTFSETPKIQHTYNQSGNYTVRLIVSTECNRDTLSRVIFIGRTPTEHLQFVNNIQLLPNPAIDELKVLLDLNEPQKVTFILWNVLGQESIRIQTERAKTFQQPLDVSNLASGSYILQIRSENGLSINKNVVIQH